MSKTIHPSIIAQRSFSMLTGKPKAMRPLVAVQHGHRTVGLGNKLGVAYFTREDIRSMDEARAESAARTMLVNAINDLQ